MAGIFAASSLGGVGYAEGMNMGSQVGVQLIGILATLAWTAAVTFVILKVIDAILGLRVTDEEETEGLDTTQHDERGYII
jgi:Amt family ammonium transporter